MENPNVTDTKTLYCNFCGKSQHDVKKLIAGPTAFICDECVELCVDIIVEEKKPPKLVVAENEQVEKARQWLIDDHTAEQKKIYDEKCTTFNGKVEGGLFDRDPRILGYITGLKAVGEKINE